MLGKIVNPWLRSVATCKQTVCVATCKLNSNSPFIVAFTVVLGKHFLNSFRKNFTKNKLDKRFKRSSQSDFLRLFSFGVTGFSVKVLLLFLALWTCFWVLRSILLLLKARCDATNLHQSG